MPAWMYGKDGKKKPEYRDRGGVSDRAGDDAVEKKYGKRGEELAKAMKRPRRKPAAMKKGY